MMNRVEKMKEIANEIGVRAVLREMGGKIYANVNGVSFMAQGFASFDAKCRELVKYEAPAPVDLTSRLTKIEERVLEGVR